MTSTAIANQLPGHWVSRSIRLNCFIFIIALIVPSTKIAWIVEWLQLPGSYVSYLSQIIFVVISICDRIWENVHSKHIQFFNFVNSYFFINDTIYTSNFTILATYKFLYEWHINVKLARIVELLFLYHSWTFQICMPFSLVHYYGSPNVKNRMCELCMFSQMRSHLQCTI